MRTSLLRLVCALCVLGFLSCRRQPAPHVVRAVAPLALVSGTLTVSGIMEAVRVVRDKWGVPHIYARNEHDLFFAQGFVQAQDRLFQMDLWRRSAQGRVSEVLGLNFVERDAATRRVQYRGGADADWASYGPGVKDIAEAFVSGINARVAEAREHVPEEFTLAGWLPETWRPEDLLNRTDAFVAGAADADIFRARLVAALGEHRADEWFPAGRPYRIPSGLDLGAVSPLVGEALRRAGTPAFFLGLAAPVPPTADRGSGSNAWIVSGTRSASGAPLLANDPHRAFAHPSLRYLVHLNAPGWNVIGATAPWLPGVAIGHNDSVAWGMAARPADITDVYVERVNPSNPHQVQYRGRWVDTTVIRDAILSKGPSKPFPFEREYTPNGVILATDGERHLAYSMRWSGGEPGTAGELAALALDRAQSAAAFTASLARWKLPVVDVIYAGLDGVVGRQAAGLVPERSGWDGTLPAPGWTGTYQWRGWRRLDGMPHEQLPRSGGYLTAVNQDVARAGRLREVLEGTHAFSGEDFERLQRDTTAWNAEQLVPLLADLRSSDSETERARQRLLQWDKRVTADSAAASLYVFWEDALGRKLLGRIPADMAGAYLARAGAPVAALTKPSGVWFEADPVAARDRLLLDALAIAAGRVRAARSDQVPPPWGSLHTLTFRHPLAITQAARRRFDIGPFQMAGYAGTVQSTFPGPEVNGGPSFKAILDLAAWDRSRWTNAPGQSGSPGSAHFADLAASWAAGEYFQMAFSDDAVRAVAEATLTLQPR